MHAMFQIANDISATMSGSSLCSVLKALEIVAFAMAASPSADTVMGSTSLQPPLSPTPTPGSSSSNRSSPASSAGSPAHRPGNVTSDIDRLLQEQKRIKAEKKAFSVDMKNTQRRRKRLRQKARLLSADDLMNVVQLRQDELSAKVRVRGGLRALELPATHAAVNCGEPSACPSPLAHKIG